MNDPVKRPKISQKNLKLLIPQMARDLSHLECSTTLGQLIRDRRGEILKKSLARTKKGSVIKQKLSDATDDAILGLFAAGAAIYPDEARHLTVCAVGGYGRRALAPFSDIDLLFLHSPYARQKIKPLLDYILYALWDTGFAISQSVHSPATAMAFVKENLSGNTSYLDVRLLAGGEDLFKDFQNRYARHRHQTVREFIEAKLQEREERLIEDFSSRYHVEPDIKEGKGGLRDLQTIHWLARYSHGTETISDHIQAGIFSEEEATSYEKALEFLWSVRVQMHDLRGRADERLTFEIQPDIAERLGYRDMSKMPAVERLMKHYFITAVEVGRLTGVICASLEEAELKKPRLTLTNFLAPIRGRKGQQVTFRQPRPDEIGSADGFCLRGGRLDFVDHDTLSERPADLLRLFRIAGRQPACDIHPEALKAVASAARFLDKSAAQDPDIATIFKAIVLDTEDPEANLRDMAEAGLLGSYLPVFGRLIGRVKYGLFRHYTLDEHVLKSIGILLEISNGDLSKEFPITTGILSQAEDLMPYFLSVLMHESIEAFPHLSEDRVEKEVRNSLKGLVAESEDVDTIVWAVMNHKLMGATTARRNVMEGHLVRHFCNQVTTLERLNYLMVLTICRLRVLGMQSSDNWTRRDITVLYNAAKAWFEGGNAALEQVLRKRREAFRNKTARKLSDWSVPELERFFARLTPVFFEGANPESAARFARMVKEVDSSSTPGAALVTSLPDGLTEVMVYSRDRPGLYAAIAGTIASVGGAVRASAAFPVRSAGKGADMAANIFMFRRDYDRGMADRPDDPEVLKQLTERFTAALSGQLDSKLNMLPRIGDRRHTFDVVSKVALDQDTSEDALIVEARGLDRPGLLYQLASALSDIGVSIRSAYVATYGEVAIDTFYVQDLPGYKITDRRRQEVIKRRLLSVLDDR